VLDMTTTTIGYTLAGLIAAVMLITSALLLIS
jgi:hypothetical protein